MVSGPKHMTYKEKRGKLGLFSLMRRLRCNTVASHNYLKGSYKGDGILCLVVPRGNGNKLQLGRFTLDSRKKHVTRRVAQYWHGLSSGILHIGIFSRLSHDRPDPVLVILLL